MKLGYIRVSRNGHTTILQKEALQQEQCELLFLEKMLGEQEERPAFLRMLSTAGPGDVIVVWRLDRFGKSLKQVVETVKLLGERRIEVRSLKEDIDTSTPLGKILFQYIEVLAEAERDILRERAEIGLEAARARGRKGGRPKAIKDIDPHNLIRAKRLYATGLNTIQEIMDMTGFKSRGTFYKYVVNEAEQE